MQMTQRHDFHQALQQQDGASQRNEELEGVQRDRVGVEGLFADGERLGKEDQPAQVMATTPGRKNSRYRIRSSVAWVRGRKKP
jgi:hypothetical protein